MFSGPSPPSSCEITSAAFVLFLYHYTAYLHRQKAVVVLCCDRLRLIHGDSGYVIMCIPFIGITPRVLMSSTRADVAIQMAIGDNSLPTDDQGTYAAPLVLASSWKTWVELVQRLV